MLSELLLGDGLMNPSRGTIRAHALVSLFIAYPSLMLGDELLSPSWLLLQYTILIVSDIIAYGTICVGLIVLNVCPISVEHHRADRFHKSRPWLTVRDGCSELSCAIWILLPISLVVQALVGLQYELWFFTRWWIIPMGFRPSLFFWNSNSIKWEISVNSFLNCYVKQ